MQIKNTALRLAGVAMIAVALAPWVGGAAANAAVTVYLAEKWNDTNSATADVSQAGCDYSEIHQEHSGQGWHFVLPGGSGLTTFTANFQTAGQVTVTTTETSGGVIVQGGKGAVIYTPTDDTLVGLAAFAGHAGQGSAASAGNNDMQLSHLCGAGDTPDDTPTPTTPVETTSSAPVTTTTSAPPTTNTAPVVVTTTASQSVAQQSVSVLPTKAENTTATESDDTEVLAAEAGQLPHTGAGLPVGVLLAVSLGLLLGGGALMLLPGLALAKGQHRRH
jgi:hypothetical protein